MNTIIAGSRNFCDYECLARVMARVSQEVDVTCVISGCARGADTLGEEWANKRGLPVMRYPADWGKYGRAAGPRRNAEMAEVGDVLVAFLSEGSRGTADMIHRARMAGMIVFVEEV